MTTSGGQDFGVSAAFVKQVKSAQNNVKSVGFLGIIGGAFVLVYMLAPAIMKEPIVWNMTNVGLLAGGTVGLFLGFGLLNYSEGARQAGAMWFLAWGLLNIIVGFTSAINGSHDLTSIFTLVAGAIQIMLAAILTQPASAFVCQYMTPELTEDRIKDGIKKAAEDKSPDMQKFIAKANM
jgi:hypothetical protein